MYAHTAVPVDMAAASTQKEVTQPWYVYMIQTARGNLYTGITTDLERRFNEHLATHAQGSSLGAKYFRSQEPRALVYQERHPDKASAAKRECQIKKLSANAKRQLVAACAARSE